MTVQSGTGEVPVSLDVDAIRDSLRHVKDPELGLSIMDLGLVYDISVDKGNVHVRMTLTSPGCPAGGQIMSDAQGAVQLLHGVGHVDQHDAHDVRLFGNLDAVCAEHNLDPFVDG